MSFKQELWQNVFRSVAHNLYVNGPDLFMFREALQHVSISYEIIFREFFIYFLVDVADIKNC